MQSMHGEPAHKHGMKTMTQVQHDTAWTYKYLLAKQCSTADMQAYMCSSPAPFPSTCSLTYVSITSLVSL